MFTGIVAALGKISAIKQNGGDATFSFATGDLDLNGVALGDSIAVNGTCLTVTEVTGDGFVADLSPETLGLTTMGDRAVGDTVNLERALGLGQELGGHLVTGHVDGVATVKELVPASDSVRLVIELPENLARYVARKGSVCVDGTSLTVNSVASRDFEVMIIPHTQERTIIASYAPGTRVNIEVDLIARYLERLMQYTDT